MDDTLASRWSEGLRISGVARNELTASEGGSRLHCSQRTVDIGGERAGVPPVFGDLFLTASVWRRVPACEDFLFLVCWLFLFFQLRKEIEVFVIPKRPISFAKPGPILR